MSTTVVQNCALQMCNSATMSSDLSWNDYRIFLALSRQRSLGQAARALGVNLSTVRRRLASLEEHLGTRLIERRREGVILTRTGERLLPRALVLEAAAAQIEREVGGADNRLQGTVRLTAGEAFIARIIAPALGRFCAAWPAIEVELLADNQRVDLLRGEAHVAVRLSRPTDASVVARKIGVLGFGLYASRSYLSRAGHPRSPDDLSAHAFVGYDAALERTPETQRLLAQGVTFKVRCSGPLGLYATVGAGVGIAAIAHRFAALEPGLERVLPSLELPSRDIWLASPRELSRTARVRAVHGFVAELLRS